MSESTILDAIREVEETPVGRSIELRMSFSRLVIRRIRELGLNQRKLADLANKKESYISRVLNGDQNCSFDTAAELLFALKTNAEFTEREETTRWRVLFPDNQVIQLNAEDYASGQETKFSVKTSKTTGQPQIATRRAAHR